MNPDPRIGVVIPALNEERSVGRVIADIPSIVAEIVVVDNGSSDRTAEVASAAGATVLREDRRGYGFACLKGIAHLRDSHAEIVVFLDGDYSDHPEELSSLVAPILRGDADMVIGSRATGEHESGALLPQARFGNWLATTLIRMRWGVAFTDLGPFRAIRMDALDRLHMSDGTYGWTVEMQIKAAMLHLRSAEIPVKYRTRIGESKVTGTITGSAKAGIKILWTIARYALSGSSLRG